MMGETASIQSLLGDLRTHAQKNGDDALFDLVIEMESRLGATSQSINVGNISNSTAVAIGNGIEIAIHQSNLPEILLARLNMLIDALEQTPAIKVEALPIWPQGKSPFPGLRAFGPEDAPIFFGRTAETDQLVTRLSNSDCHFLMVVGASGSGKSSLVKAGLLPRLRVGALPGSENWPIIMFTPDAFGKGDPFDVLAWSLSKSLLGVDIRMMDARLRKNRSGLRQVLEEHLPSDPKGICALLIIDQFEELFTRVVDEGLRGKFQALINEAATSPRILIVVTMRDELYHYCVKSPILARLINRNTDSTFTLSAPSTLALYEMITAPARLASLEYEGDLAQRIHKDTGSDPGALALMAYTLDQLYKASGSDNKLNLSAYLSFGGVQGAIGTRAQETFDRLSEDAKKTLPWVFRELLEVDESGTATRKRSLLELVERDSASHELVQAFVEARLFVTTQNAKNQALVEVAHEALFRSWPRLKSWIEEAQDDLILLRQVRNAADWWDKHQRQSAYMWPDERLQPVYAMRRRLVPNLNETEQEFIRLEVERLLEEVDNPLTTHRSRSWSGERLDTLGDPRPGVRLVQDILPLRAEEGKTYAFNSLRPGEIRLWGDKPEHKGLPDIVWCYVQGGSIRIEKQSFKVHPFYIAKYPITYMQFEAFVEAKDGFKDTRWWEGLSAEEYYKSRPGEQKLKFDNHPREFVSWYDAIAFCRWLNARLKWPDTQVGLSSKTLINYTGLRLPTEWEWQWTATGGNAKYEYPWGVEWDGNKANTSESGLGRTTAVGMYPTGSADCGALDLSGNVFEWCLNEYGKLENIGVSGEEWRVVRGGSWSDDQEGARASYRRYSSYRLPSARNNDLGFRVAVRRPSL